MRSDLALSDMRGPVRSLREEHARWNPGLDIWDAPRGFTLFTFRPDGQVSEREFHNPDGSVARLSREFDAGGRVVAERSWGGQGVGRTTVYEYDASGRPAATLQVTPDGARRQVETCSYDADGRQTTVVDLTTVSGVNCHRVDGTMVRSEEHT